MKYSPGEDGGSASRPAQGVQRLLMEYLPKLGAALVPRSRARCGGCLDSVSITQPLEEHGVFMADLALEEEFMGKLKAIDGTSQHETQEITFVKM